VLEMAYKGNRHGKRSVGRTMEGINEFRAWHTGRTKRKTGRAPAATTLATFGYRVRQAAKVAGVEAVPELAEHLEQPELAEAILDKLALTNPVGSLRHTWGACTTSPSTPRSRGG
jgi:hypothetical protein